MDNEKCGTKNDIRTPGYRTLEHNALRYQASYFLCIDYHAREHQAKTKIIKVTGDEWFKN